MYNILMKSLKLQPKFDQRGLVSIVVVSVIVVLMALITLGFSKVMDRELRQSLDQELSSQAYYAAEAGLNDARAYVNSIKNNPSANPDPKKCMSLFAPFAVNGDISGNGIVKYTCVLIDMQPRELIYDVNASNSVVFKTSATNLSKLYFSWQNRQSAGTSPQPLGRCGNSNPVSCDLPEENAMAPDATGVLRVTIYPVYNAADYAGDPNPKLASDSRTFFLYPNHGLGLDFCGGNCGNFYSYYNNNSNGTFLKGNCNNAHPKLPFVQSTQRFCNTQISQIPDAAQYYVHISAVYKDLSVSIQGADTNDKSLPLPGAEAVVDVTGEGNDVLRRVQARIPFDSGFSYPNNSINSMQTICKRFRLPKTGLGPNDYDPAVLDTGGFDSVCPIVSSSPSP